ncbi:MULTISPECIES: hypothetical protein [Xanthomarina]|jgi:hypothetical protein|uniref:Uncharacterized protein n=1 Tax=Xanthomarina gelatinilytica TaxID=1137281 RepID=M7MIM1_9FLAO|nr:MULTISPECIES: hypothetical protein [Xanthomarina]EMQ94690.1 hypothetical protein D778_00644 [Xanthomarina gelatinilytica]MCB0387246.1 hypothetical protein [Winogradskyella sp.]MDX1316368.1 hypothetical protein [Xanthomarina gelatinilytica]|tara:strand:- start:1186 stop:1338 length:153 start_codon:yes stop_codon:yes gene_type:complete
MPIIKDEDSDRKDYLLQDDKKTRFGAKFIIITLILLAIAVVASGLYFKWF